MAVSATPGLQAVEDQPVRQAIDASSTVVVVGASRGIGLELARQIAKRGALVFATYRGRSQPSELTQLVAQAGTRRSNGPLVRLLSLDVTEEVSVKAFSSALRTALPSAGSSGITHVVHNAGIIGDGARFGHVTADDMMRVFRVNTLGVVHVAQALAPLLASRAGNRAPVLAILSSKVGSVDDNGSGGMYAYRASKSACNVVAKSLAIDLAPRAAVVLLHPGYVRTGMTRYNGFIDPAESVTGLLRAIEATDGTVGFRWVDYKAQLIPW